ncbi:TIGR02300 family protein [Frigidibacter sp. ROC022]|uniref:TIGR02300 family protein n=1 Tax=Frigidibacter sp. ROC022 TaxID=2971796 RepID=UPI00215A1AA9|nr:TIGR02300 family protein [Frigidibacter sp. ROC022]MCR8722747.1 TIGR02300 family protein [Frigidibacter sp. ROC022]
MPKTEWGTKRVCPVTGKRFYDMNRDPVVSPYTGEVVNIDTAGRNRVLVADKADKKAVVAEEEEEVVLEDDADDVADAEIDDDLLEDDDDDDSVSLDEIADVPGDDDDS